jgi:hypothetical protein
MMSALMRFIASIASDSLNEWNALNVWNDWNHLDHGQLHQRAECGKIPEIKLVE